VRSTPAEGIETRHLVGYEGRRERTEVHLREQQQRRARHRRPARARPAAGWQQPTHALSSVNSRSVGCERSPALSMTTARVSMSLCGLQRGSTSVATEELARRRRAAGAAQFQAYSMILTLRRPRQARQTRGRTCMQERRSASEPLGRGLLPSLTIPGPWPLHTPSSSLLRHPWPLRTARRLPVDRERSPDLAAG